MPLRRFARILDNRPCRRQNRVRLSAGRRESGDVVKRPIVLLALADAIVYIVVWGMGLLYTATPFAHDMHFLYWLTAAIGLILLVYGFTVLVRGGNKRLSEAVLLVLFSMIPGLTMLVAVLSHLGTKPV